MLDPASAFPPVVSPEIARPTSLDDASKGEGLEFLAALDEAQANESRTESHVGVNVGERPHEQPVVEVEGSQTEGGGDHDAKAGNRATPSVAGQSETLGSQTTEFAGVDVDTATVITSNGESLSPVAAVKEENPIGASLIFRPDGKAETGSSSSEDGQALTTKVTKIHPGQSAFLPHIAGSQSATPTSTNAPPVTGKVPNLSTQAASNTATSVATETTAITFESPKSVGNDGQASPVELTIETATALPQTSNPAATLNARSVAAENRPTVPGQPSESPITSSNVKTPAGVDSELADAATGDAATGDTDSSDTESGSSQRDSHSPGIRNATVGNQALGSESPRFNLPDGFTAAGFTGDSPGNTTDSPAISADKAALTGTLSWESTNPFQSNTPAVSNVANGNVQSGTALPGDPWQDTANIRNQVTSSVLSARLEGKSGGHRMEIKLDPPELGKISIEFIGKDNELTARIQAAEPATLTALRADLPALVETLEDAGIVLDEFHLNQSSDDGDFQPGNRGQEESGDKDTTTYDDTTEMDEIDSTRKPSGRLDITA